MGPNAHDCSTTSYNPRNWCCDAKKPEELSCIFAGKNMHSCFHLLQIDFAKIAIFTIIFW